MTKGSALTAGFVGFVVSVALMRIAESTIPFVCGFWVLASIVISIRDWRRSRIKEKPHE